MTRSVDYISFDATSRCFGSAAGEGKVHLDVEEGDDYNSDEDICGSSLSFKFESSPSPSLRQPNFIAQSNGKRPADDHETHRDLLDDAKRLRFTPPGPAKALTLPESIWAEIFSQLPPQKLAQLRRTCRLFQKFLLNQSIWRASRKQWMPEMPKPVFSLKEWEMLALAKGDGCMICGNRTHTHAIYWAFRVRCCTQCFNRNMTKESSLASSGFPMSLLAALPYGFIDASGQWVPNAHNQLSGAGLSKVYWNTDLESIKERYEEAKAMDAEEEWLKGLESEGHENRSDIMRMESFESRWYSRGKIKSIGNATKPSPATGYSSLITTNGFRCNSTKPNWQQFQSSHTILHPHAHPQPQYPPSAHNGIMHPSFSSRPHQHNLPLMLHSQQGQISPGTTWPTGYPQGQPFPPTKHSLPRNTSRPERSISEVAEVRARRQHDIEARCLKLAPPLLPNVLQHIPAFKAALLIAMPLTDQAWDNLLPKLLEQRAEAEETERVKLEGQIKVQKQSEEKKASEVLQRELREKKEKEWDDTQAPVRQKLDRYATDIINLWLARHPATQHPAINRDSALRFAPEVLVQVRKKFYEVNPYTAQDPGHLIMLDPSTPQGAAALEIPTGNRLLLENMKYVFDTKIKPITDQVRKELFLCSGCENNPKFYGFEGVIQHYAAKHTNLMSLGSVIVHWKADWPHFPPFILDPLASASNTNKHVAHASSHHQYQVGHPNTGNSTFGTYNRMGMHMSTQMEISHHATMVTNGFPNAEGTFTNGVYTTFPVARQPYGPNQHNGSLVQTISINSPMNDMSRLQQTLPTTFTPYQQQSEMHHRAQLEEIAVTAREAWFQLNGIKDLPSSVRVHYVIQKVVRAFQAKFASPVLQLNMFIEALREHNLMKPLRNVNGLHCLACVVNSIHTYTNNSGSGAHPVGRVFTLVSLIQHFETVHIIRNRSCVKPDWKTQMIRLPEQRAIGMLRDAMGMDEEKLRLLKEAFPIAFNLPLPTGRVSDGFIPSSGPFPKPAHSVASNFSSSSSSSSCLDSTNSPSPLRSVATKETSPASERGSPSPKSPVKSHSSSCTENLNKKTTTKLADAYKHDTRHKNFVPIKSEPTDDLEPPRVSKKASMTAAERFLATFLQEDGNPASFVQKAEPTSPVDSPVPKKKRLCIDTEKTDFTKVPLRPITPRFVSPPSSGTSSRIKRHSIDTNPELYSPRSDQHYRYRSPIREERRSISNLDPVSPAQARYQPIDQPLENRSYSPRPTSPRRRSTGSNSEDRGRGLHMRPYSPHSRSRSPRFKYYSVHPAEGYYDPDHRAGFYTRESFRDYIPDEYGYREHIRPSARSLMRRPPVLPEGRYYETVYDESRYLNDENIPKRKSRERSRSPLSRYPPFGLAPREITVPQEYKYGYIPSVAHHPSSYYPYPQHPIPPGYPYMESSRYCRKSGSRSPVYEIDPKRLSSTASRYPSKAYLDHSLQAPILPLRGHRHYDDHGNDDDDNDNDDDDAVDYLKNRRYRQLDMVSSVRSHADVSNEDSFPPYARSIRESRIGEPDDVRY
ncbi:hypothetical protein BDZ91DRAFT_723073 [Kalaharituber pfeilii]|nr:hypothetical protein BDZ91DRAFT_723073 [Kalaharituber pfeilii]